MPLKKCQPVRDVFLSFPFPRFFGFSGGLLKNRNPGGTVANDGTGYNHFSLENNTNHIEPAIRKLPTGEVVADVNADGPCRTWSCLVSKFCPFNNGKHPRPRSGLYQQHGGAQPYRQMGQFRPWFLENNTTPTQRFRAVPPPDLSQKPRVKFWNINCL